MIQHCENVSSFALARPQWQAFKIDLYCRFTASIMSLGGYSPTQHALVGNKPLLHGLISSLLFPSLHMLMKRPVKEMSRLDYFMACHWVHDETDPSSLEQVRHPLCFLFALIHFPPLLLTPTSKSFSLNKTSSPIRNWKANYIQTKQQVQTSSEIQSQGEATMEEGLCQNSIMVQQQANIKPTTKQVKEHNSTYGSDVWICLIWGHVTMACGKSTILFEYEKQHSKFM